MSTGTFIKEDELLKKGMEILLEKLGPVETNRFLSIQKYKRMESVKRHREWQKKLGRKDFFNDIFK